nr:AraC family transcriptional regulator [Paenibacillus turpanensis]
MFFRSLLNQLLLFVIRKIPDKPDQETLSAAGKSIHEIIRYCNEHYKEQLTLNQISKDFFLSPSYVGRLFRKYTGFSFPEYLNSLRIREAQRLLREEQLKIEDVSQRVGYINKTHFNKTFKQITQMSPLQYKKMTEGMDDVTLRYSSEFLEKNK